MARLNGYCGDRPERDRGQILVVGAFALALLIVALALVLNGAAFTETLATTYDGGPAGEALSFEHDARAGVGGVIVAVNREGHDSTTALDAALAAALVDWDEFTSAEASTRGTATEIADVTVTSHGYRIAQANDTRRFTDASGASDWTLATDVTDAPQFRMNVNRTSLASEGDAEQFTVNVTNPTETWRASFAQNGTAIVATVVQPDGTETSCTVAADSAVVDFANGRLGNESCPALASYADLADENEVVRVGFERATEGAGTYELVVDPDATVTDDGRFDDAGSPALTPAIYSVDVTVRYDSSRVTYATRLQRVTAGDARA